MSYMGEVTTTGDAGKYTDNALRFATEPEARQYVTDLAMRWTAVADYRVAESNDPVNSAIVEKQNDRGRKYWELEQLEEKSNADS